MCLTRRGEYYGLWRCCDAVVQIAAILDFITPIHTDTLGGERNLDVYNFSYM